MKKRVLYVGIATLLCLSACGSKEEIESSNPVIEKNIWEQSQSTTGVIEFQKLAEAEARAFETTKEQEKLYSAKNGVMKTVGVGDGTEEEVSYRPYQIPDSWQPDQVDGGTQPMNYIYRVSENGLKMGVQLYTLNAYQTSPLSGGEIMKKEEVTQGLKADGQDFIQETSISINDQEWQVGYEVKPENKAAKITFYRLEDTGNFDDSVIVGSVVYPLSSEYLNQEETVMTTVSQLKTILYQVAANRQTEIVAVTP
ncbi:MULTISPECIES: hypothetical protein [unclassified Streptococcus]|uniref:hypothetical protein n=1 Tax=unclassified Streptococcus TaxID=2608887 RepID=UPI0010715D2F|nr:MULTISPECIES: hypothetical protein [unclassified Streptococcus]MBF0787905.1 hypothetical protein [Streptococcus sp. 19428wC2_LYSM12]MCQ9212173.1 hypothetical protein [Streptococcus sp. B01]MCQ9213503.1 hypothetical protein [Streptococcus sp. O1]TFV05088.1 hypothetical protein E4T79_08455 [Streptococcus sp. LYSM12]